MQSAEFSFMDVRKALIAQHLKILKDLQYDTGLFAASDKSVSTGYDKSWLRDNFYECLAFEILRDWETVYKTYRALLNIFIKHEYKLDHAITKKPEHRHQYIHARFHPHTFEEFWEEWGNKQNDAIGAILFGIGSIELSAKHDSKIIETAADVRVINKLVQYLISIQYWHDIDSGMWEEDEEIHASSIGACVAGLKAISKVKGVHVPSSAIVKGRKALDALLPRESKKKFVDLSLLSLIWPYHVVTKEQREKILSHIEYHLLRKKGVIRYKNDHYYNKNTDGYSEEAEWTFGLSWLSIIYRKFGMMSKAAHFEQLALAAVNKKGQVPELYYSNTNIHNDNSPLGWSESMLVIALHEMQHKHFRDVKS